MPRLFVIHPDYKLSGKERREISHVRYYCSMAEDGAKIDRFARSLGNDIRRYPLTRTAEDLYSVAVKKYSNRVANLAGAYRNRDFWWLSHFTEKNGYPSELVTADLIVECLKKISGDEDILFISSNEVCALFLRRDLAGCDIVVKGYSHYVKSFVSKYLKLCFEVPGSIAEVIRRMFWARRYHTKETLLGCRYEIEECLIKTYVNENELADDGTYADSHYGIMTELLRHNQRRWAYEPNTSTVGRLAGYHAWVRSKAKDKYFIPEALWTLRHLLYALICVANNIWFLHRMGMRTLCATRSFYAQLTIMNYMKSLTPEMLKKVGMSPKVFIFNWENKGHEKRMIELYRKYHNRTKIIGFANGFISPLIPEASVSRAEIECTPLPDVIVCMSGYVRDVLLGLGYPEKILREGCSFRDRYVHKFVGMESSCSNIILLCTPMNTWRSMEMIEFMRAIAEFVDGYRIVVRLHPYSAPSVKRKVDACSYCMDVSDVPVEHDLARARVVIVSGITNMICEAYASGKATFKYSSQNYLNNDCLEYYPDARVPTFSTKRELLWLLRSATDRVIGGDVKTYLFGEYDERKHELFQ